MKIAIDAFGGDNAPDEVVKGAVDAVKEYGVDIVLTGDTKKLDECFERLGLSKDHITFEQADGVIEIEDNPKMILKEKKNCSMGVAMQMVADGRADAMISAGSTAALVMGGTLIVKRIKGVKRPSLTPVMPGLNNMYILLDGGANVDCRPDMLRQFAVMGSVYMIERKGVTTLVTSIIAAVTNIVGNFILIPICGVNGAAYSTCFSYFIVFVIRAIHTRKFIRINYSVLKFGVNAILTLAQAIIMITEVPGWIIYEVILTLLVLLLNIKVLILSFKKIVGRFGRKKAKT
mgnify:CR=1 FL=1